MSATEILVIILSIFLAIFLVVAIALSVLLIKVTLQIKRVTTKAEKAANGFENMAANISKVTSQAYIGRMLLKQARRFSSKKIK